MLRPSWAFTSALAVSISPTFDALRCSTYISAPTVVSPSSRSGAKACMAVFYLSALSDGVEKTSREPEPTARAVS